MNEAQLLIKVSKAQPELFPNFHKPELIKEPKEDKPRLINPTQTTRNSK